MAVGLKPMLDGVLDAKTVEFIAIAVDASCTHMYAPGVRRHIRKALELGATKEEIAAVLQLTSVLGIHTMSLAHRSCTKNWRHAPLQPPRRAEARHPPKETDMQFLDDALLPETQDELIIPSLRTAPSGRRATSPRTSR